MIQKQFFINPVTEAFAKVEYHKNQRFLGCQKSSISEHIEELGEGWNKIIKEHKEHPLKPKLPKIIADKSSMLVSLFSTKEKFEERKEMLVLNERQMGAIEYLKKKGRVTNEEYQKMNNTNRITSFRDLKDMVDKKIIEMIGKTGKYTYYVLKR